MSHIRYFSLCFVNAAMSVSKRHVDLAQILKVIRSQWKPPNTTCSYKGTSSVLLVMTPILRRLLLLLPFTIRLFLYLGDLSLYALAIFPFILYLSMLCLTCRNSHGSGYEEHYYFPRCNVVILTFRRNVLIPSLGEKCNTQAVS